MNYSQRNHISKSINAPTIAAKTPQDTRTFK